MPCSIGLKLPTRQNHLPDLRVWHAVHGQPLRPSSPTSMPVASELSTRVSYFLSQDWGWCTFQSSLSMCSMYGIWWNICINVYSQNNQHIPYITIHRASTQSHEYSIDINYTILNHTKTPACHCQWDQWFSENHVKRGWFIKHDGQMWE